MRQGQHKNRSRGRNQRRQGGNPSNRVFESNGPDVKVRGTAQTVADKYLQLARDAVSAGDIVMSESYFQHAEHYMRIIAASQAQQQQQQQQRQQESAPPAGGNGSDQPEIPGTGPQPASEAATGTGDQPEISDNAGNGKGAGGDGKDKTGFSDDLPQFLKANAEEDAAAEKPKRARRTRKRDDADAVASGEAEADGGPAADPASDTEAAAS